MLCMQWLSAVELGLLKGRHPLLKDVDVTINPSGSLALVEGRETDKRVKVNKLVDLVQTNTLNGYPVEASKQILEDSYSEAHFHLRSGQESQRNLELDHKGSQDVALQEAQSVDTDLVEEGGASPDDGERGQVLQTAQVVLNMLDVTVPGTLTEEQKRKVMLEFAIFCFDMHRDGLSYNYYFFFCRYHIFCLHCHVYMIYVRSRALL